MDEESKTSPYLMDEPPTSPGRAFLARAVAHWCALHWGVSEHEVAAALDGAPDADPAVRRQVAGATRLLGEVLAAGRLKAWARPIGGGPPVAVAADAWELDDFRPRMAASAIAVERPYDALADPTHWLFVELDGFNELVEASCADVRAAAEQRAPRSRAARGDRHDGEAGAHADVRPSDPERFIRLPEVKIRTGMSRSTIYDRIREGRFPATVPMEGNIAAWRETDIADWLAKPR